MPRQDGTGPVKSGLRNGQGGCRKQGGMGGRNGMGQGSGRGKGRRGENTPPSGQGQGGQR